MLIIAKRTLSKGRMQYGHSYEVDDIEGERLIAAGLAVSAETLRDRNPQLADELEAAAEPESLIGVPVDVEVLVQQGNETEVAL